MKAKYEYQKDCPRCQGTGIVYMAAWGKPVAVKVNCAVCVKAKAA